MGFERVSTKGGTGDVRNYMVLFSMYVEEDAEVSCIPVVSEFPEVFPDDILNFETRRESLRHWTLKRSQVIFDKRSLVVD